MSEYRRFSDNANATGPTCEFCKWAVFQEQGYSDWTVTGVSFTCVQSQQPDIEDVWYEEPKMEFAKNCAKYEKGGKDDAGPLTLNVEFQAPEDCTLEELELLRMAGVL